MNDKKKTAESLKPSAVFILDKFKRISSSISFRFSGQYLQHTKTAMI